MIALYLRLFTRLIIIEIDLREMCLDCLFEVFFAEIVRQFAHYYFSLAARSSIAVGTHSTSIVRASRACGAHSGPQM